MEDALIEQPPRSFPDHREVTSERTEVSEHDIADFLRMIWPRSAAHLPKIRVGCAHDGGYVLPITALACDTVVSIGIGDNASFDFELADYGMTVLQFDHTIARPPVFHENFRFHRCGWSAFAGRSMLSFADIMALFRDLRPGRSILKFDIEGCEYDAFSVLSADDISDFEIITCELHGLHELGCPRFFERATYMMEVLGMNHVPIHLHANNYGETAEVGDFAVPDVIELTFARKNFGPFEAYSTDPIPGPLDFPNNPLLPDIRLTALQDLRRLRAVARGGC